jgi:Fic family protein
MRLNKEFSERVTIFHGIRLPEVALPVGYAALIDAYNLLVPLPYKLSCIGHSHRKREEGGWVYYTPRHTPAPTLGGHLAFALKNEGVDLAVLKSLFIQVKAPEIEKIIKDTPTGIYARRIWFLYEWLLGEKLDLPDLKTGNYIPLLDPKLQFSLPGVNCTRQRVINNLPGTRNFCPLVFKTPLLSQYLERDLKSQAVDVIKKISSDVISRTAVFLLLKDSKASYAIENEPPLHKRIERWGQVIGQAGAHPFNEEELVRLQKIVIGDMRFVKPGLRQEGGFVGEHDRDTGTPLPEHVSAKAADLSSLLKGLMDYTDLTNGKYDPVIAAAILAFGFVYIHPFADGNGRLHRYLIHHVLAEEGFNPPGLVFPVSAVMLDRIEDYRRILKGYSEKLLPLIQWEPTRDNNVKVINETSDYYRYFDATPHAEFLYSCVQRTIDFDLPQEAWFLQRYDLFKGSLSEIIEMPSQTVDLLFRFLKQNEGKLSARARTKEFKELSDKETWEIETLYKRIME